MLTPSFICSTDPAIVVAQIETPDKLIDHIQTCSHEQFTGRLDIESLEPLGLRWSLFFRLGHFVWAADEVHPIRRWCRQLSQFCPQLVDTSKQLEERLNTLQHWNYAALAELVRQRKISHEQMAAVVKGNIIEVLFDIIHLWQQECQGQAAQRFQLSYRHIPSDIAASTSILIPVQQAWQKAFQAWNAWQQNGLINCSPNLAPVIWDAEALRQQTSLLAYHNLTTLVNGERTLRDLGAKLNQNPLPLTLSIMPYIRREAIGLVEVSDLNPAALSSAESSQSMVGLPPTPRPTPPTSPLVVYIDDSRFDNMAMNRIVGQVGCRVINIRDPVQALPILLEQKPDLIFLDLLMPVTNGYEVCSQIRRISVFKETPVIIVTASDGIVDRVRAKLVGSSGFISKPIEPEKVLTVLQQYLPLPFTNSSRFEPNQNYFFNWQT
ncbi:response regulator [Phormidium tenue FACHB-886]|nr:response regulator [Phormidium tenue FACHB-886]